MAYVDALSDLEHFDDGTKPWCDLVFDLTTLERSAVKEHPAGLGLIWGSAIGQSQGREVGFGFEIPIEGWKERKLEDADISIHFGKISLLSTGEPTDHLIALYEDYFEFPKQGIHARARNDCPAVLLGGSLSLNKPFTARTKLFFDFDANDSLHAEVFFAIDTEAKRVRLSEKDPEYREPLLHWLRAG